MCWVHILSCCLAFLLCWWFSVSAAFWRHWIYFQGYHHLVDLQSLLPNCTNFPPCVLSSRRLKKRCVNLLAYRSSSCRPKKTWAATNYVAHSLVGLWVVQVQRMDLFCSVCAVLHLRAVKSHIEEVCLIFWQAVFWSRIHVSAVDTAAT